MKFIKTKRKAKDNGNDSDNDKMFCKIERETKKLDLEGHRKKAEDKNYLPIVETFKWCASIFKNEIKENYKLLYTLFHQHVFFPSSPHIEYNIICDAWDEFDVKSCAFFCYVVNKRVGEKLFL